MKLLGNLLSVPLLLWGGSSLVDARITGSALASHFATSRALEAPAFDCNALDCNDDNSLTTDSCDPNSGCQHACDDGNACTRESVVDGICQYVDDNGSPYDCNNEDGSDCIPGLIDCSDNNPFTADVCVPSSGCRHFSFVDYVENLVGLDSVLQDLEAEETIFYEEQSSLNEGQVMAIMDWIKLEVTQLRTPFCWRRSYGRGVGEALAHCPPGKERIGLLCYTPCPHGYSRQGTLDCHQNCKEGWRDDGLFCRKPEYGRGVGYGWQFGDPLFSDRGMFQRCERDHGGGNCELHGLIVYPKCRFGYRPFGCCICRPDFESCEAEGYANFRIDLSCAAKIELGDPTPLQCREGLEQDGLLCYPPCEQGYNGVGPVCWQQCDSDQTWCAAGCARSTADCLFAATDQIITPIIAAANLATLGANSVPSAAAGTAIEIANQLYEFATVAGEVMGWLASVLEVTDVREAPRNARVVSFNINTGNVVLDGAISATLFGAQALMGRQFAQDFLSQTSPEIAQALAAHLDPRDLLLVQRTWADVQFWELASAEGWNFVDLVLSSFGVLDPTGLVNLLAAYVKPICLEIIPFPVCTAANCRSASPAKGFTKESYELECEDINVFATRDGNCQAWIDPISLDGGSLDPDHEKMFLTLEPVGPFLVQDAPHRVTLTATSDADHNDRKSCQATITVADNTPASVACPVGQSQNTDPGVCSANVKYETPQINQGCKSSSTAHQTGGLPSGSSFPVGTTVNTFEVVDSSAIVQGDCSFAIGIFDAEPPVLQCKDLAASIATNPGECQATHVYKPPVAVDNCGEVFTVLTQSPELDPHSFSLGKSMVEFTATDSAGNEASCSFVVDVMDAEIPVAVCDAAGDQKGVFTIGGSDNCNGVADLKAYVIDSASGHRFPTPKSGLEYYPIGTTFEFQQASKEGPSQEEKQGDGNVQWRLKGQGVPSIVIEDAAGNKSKWVPCS